MKCPKCVFDVKWRGACVTVDDVKYKAYVCHRTPECPGVIRGEVYQEAEG